MRGISDRIGNVIYMGGPKAEPGFRKVRAVEAYWEALRAGSGVPRRSDVEPRGIESALENAFILERIAPGLARLRIAGMHLSDLMGMEVRGMPVSSFILPASRAGFGEALERVTAGPARVTLTLEAETGLGKPPLDGRMVLLPLQSDLGDVSRVLGCFETRGRIGRGPRRFDVIETALEPIALAPPGADAAAPAPATLEGHGFREAQARFDGINGAGARPSRRPGAPYLRLIKTDE